MTVFFAITMFIVTLYTISIIGEHEENVRINIMCSLINIAYLAACIYLTTRGI